MRGGSFEKRFVDPEKKIQFKSQQQFTALSFSVGSHFLMFSQDCANCLRLNILRQILQLRKYLAQVNQI